MRSRTKATLRTVTVEDVDNLIAQLVSILAQTDVPNPVDWERALTYVVSLPADPSATYDRRRLATWARRGMDEIARAWPRQDESVPALCGQPDGAPGAVSRGDSGPREN